ncbi:MAG: exodeoxyribonuclease VII small subunit [Clostridiales bacterium]|jgi:exodeoxyribonuclease VII small subunit|nr:exodeoxyribonuclease VII small subunit [Clostridiales bacterium]
MQKKKQTFEQALVRLEEVIDVMETNSPSLRELFELYKEGVELTAFCVNTLNDIEKEVTVLRQTAEGIFVQTPLDAAEISGG